MRVTDILKEEEKGWWDSFKGGLSSMMSNNPDAKVEQWVKDNLWKRGSSWIYRNVNKEFPNRYTRTDIDQIIKRVMSTGR